MSPLILPDDLATDPASARSEETLSSQEGVRARESGRILLLVMDGVGGLPHPDHGRTELEAATTPNLDALAAEASLGRHHPVGPGITPGSGPGHLALFGYDPVQHQVGRGALSALGVGFDLRRGDLAIRLNLATLDGEGRVVDRRAGRPSDEEARRVVERLRREIRLQEEGVEFQLFPEMEHRAVLILRGDGLSDQVSDTDPQATGVPPLEPEPLHPDGERTARVLSHFLGRAREILSGEGTVTGVLARGFALHKDFPSLEKRFGLRGAVHARYPMYRGVARLVGMEVPGVPESDAAAVAQLERNLSGFDFHFIHFKAPDARGEDRDFEGKVEAIEAIDAFLPRLTALEPTVLVITGDHSTPATLGAHSWHPVPLLIRSPWTHPSGTRFTERECRGGELGTIPGRQILSLALAHAGRLRKYGA